MDMHDDILETLGNTPLVKLGRYSPTGATLAAKVESFNPGGSVKDRIGIAMIEAAEREGKLKPGGTDRRADLGQHRPRPGDGCSAQGYKLVCTASEKISKEKVALLEAHGARGHHLPGRRRAPTIRARTTRSPSASATRRAPSSPTSTTTRPTRRRTTGRPGRRSGGRPTAGSPTGWPASAPAAPSAAPAGTSRSRTPTIRVVGVDPVGSVYAHFHEHRRAAARRGRSSSTSSTASARTSCPRRRGCEYVDEVVAVRRPDRLPRGLRAGAQRGDLHRLVGRRRRVRARARWPSALAAEAPGGHAVPGLRRALPVEAQSRLDGVARLARRISTRIGLPDLPRR